MKNRNPSLASLSQKYRGKPKKFAEGGRARSPAAAPVATPFDADYIERLAAQAVGVGEPGANSRDVTALDRVGRRIGEAYQTFMETPERLAQQVYDDAVARGVDPESAARRAERIGRRAGLTTGAVEMAVPQTAADVAMMAAGPIGRVAPAAGRAALAGAGAMMGMEPSEAEASALRRAIRAYHGSPYRFDRFDITKIGTGEGAQAYGHGLYFAGAEPVARRYRDDLARLSPEYIIPSQRLKIDGKNYYDEIGLMFPEMSKTPKQVAIGAIERNRGNIEETYRQLMERDSPISKASAKIVGALRNRKIQYEPPFEGHMYEVRLRTTPEELVNWDAPLVRQPERAVPFLEDVLRAPRTGSARVLEREMKPIGEAIDLRTPEIAAQLREAGIPGLRYLDAGSRTGRSSTRNYVMFGDDLIDITRRYAEGGLAALDQKYADGGTVRAPSFDVREPYEGELDFFEKHPNVSGMATEDNKVILNPRANLSKDEREAVILNERARLAIKNGLVPPPDFDLTPEQSEAFSQIQNGRPYGSMRQIRETIAARILSGDPSALNPTADQMHYAKQLREALKGYSQGGTVRAPKETYISGQEHKLAYITDREAALLKARGGSGRMTEHGVRAYDEGGDGGGGGDSDSSNSNSEAGTQDAAGGNAGQGAGPTGAGAGSTGEDGPGPTGPEGGVGPSGMSNADPEGTAAAANAQTASQAQQAGVRGADTEGFAPSGFSPSMGLGEAIGAFSRGDISLAEAIGLGLQSALAPPGVTVGVNVDETGNRAPAVSIDPLGVGLGLAGLATGVPGLGMIGGMIGSQISNAVGMTPSVVGYSPGYGGEPTESPGGSDQYTEYGQSAYGLPAQQTPATAGGAPQMWDWNKIQAEAARRGMSTSEYMAQNWRNVPIGMPTGYSHGGLAKLHQKYAEGGEVYPPAGEIAEYDPDEIDRIARQIHLRLPEDERQDVVYEEAASPSDLIMRARMLMRGQNMGMPEAISAGAGNDRFSSSTSLRDMPIEDDRYGVSQRTFNTSIDAVLDAERKARIGAGMLALERGGERGFTGYGPQVSAGYGPLSVHGGYQSITPNMPGAKSQGSYVYGGNLNIPIDDGGTEANIGATVMSGRRGQDGTQITGSLERPFLGGRLGLDVSADPSLRNKEILLGYRRAF